MTDNEIAITHLVLMDAEKLEDIDILKTNISNVFNKWLDSEHDGDCSSSRHPWSCNRCIIEEALKIVPVYKALFGV